MARSFKPHRWQVECEAAVNAILANSDHAYIQAPTGVGKTLAIVYQGENYPLAGVRIIMVGTSKVARQHRTTLLRHGFVANPDGSFVSPTGKLWMVDTWQAFYAACRTGEPEFVVAVLYFDECHLGGSNAGNKSYRKIVETFKPLKKVQVSATTNVASESLLGERDGASFIYTMSSAYEDGLLNPVNMIEIETGNSVMIERIEQVSGKSMEELEELTDAKLAGLARKLKMKHVIVPMTSRDPQTVEEIEATRAAKIIIDHRHDAMMSVYLANHRGESAIFWCPNVDAAQRAFSRFSHLCDIPAAAVHSQEGEIIDLINAFEVGDVKVIFAVNMLQEGFDMPGLWLAFDCRFHRQINKYRIARMMQRIGRLTRKLAGKPASLYYVAPDLTHYYMARGAAIPRGSLIASHVLAAADMLNSDDLSAQVESFESREAVIEVDEVFESDEVPAPAGQRKVAATVTPLYVIRSARGYQETQKISLASLWADEVVLFKQEMLAAARRGDAIPRAPTREYTRLRHFLKDAAFADAIREAGWDIHYRPLTDLQMEKAAVLEMAKRGEPRPGTKANNSLGNRIIKWMHKDAAFRAAVLALNPEWRIGKGESQMTKDDFIRLAAADAEPPNAKTPDGVRFRVWVRRDPDFKSAIAAANPKWLSWIRVITKSGRKWGRPKFS